VIYAGLGEADLAFEWLERGLSSRDVNLLGIEYDRLLDGLREDARYARLLERTRQESPSL